MPELLEVGAVINLSQILPGFDRMAGAAEAATARMNASFTQLKSGLVLTSGAVSELEAAGVNLGPRLSTSLNEVEAASDRMAGGARRASMALGAMGTEIGDKMPRFLRSFLAGIGPIGGIMAAAFAPIAIIGLIEWLAKIPAAVGAASDWIMGYGEKQKKAFADTVAASNDALVHFHSLSDGAKDLAETTRRLGEIASQSVGERYYSAFKHASESTSQLYGPLYALIVAHRAHAEAAKASADAETALTERLRLQLGEYAKLAAAVRDSGYDQQREALRVGEVGATAYQRVQAQLAALKVDEQQEIDRLWRIAPLSKEAGEAIRTMYALKEEGIRRTAAIETGMESIAADRQRLSNAEATMAAMIEIQTTGARQAVVIDRDKWGQEIAFERIAAGESYNLAVSRLERERALAEREQALTGKSKLPEILRINGEIEAAEREHVARMREIDTRERQSELAGMNQIQAAIVANFVIQQKNNADEAAAALRGNEINMELADKRVSIAEQSAERTLRIESESLRNWIGMNRGSVAQWEADQKAALNRWYDAQKTVMQAAVVEAALSFGTMDVRYQQALEKLLALDQNYELRKKTIEDTAAKRTQQSINRASELFAQSMTRAIMGYESFGQAAIRIEQEIAGAAIENLLKVEMQRLLARIANKRDAEDDILVSAKVAAAGAFKSVMNVVPFPANVVLAPIAAAAAFAGTMAFGAFDEGGLATKSGLAMLHQNEIAMPPEVSSAFRSMAAGGSVGGRTSNIRNTFNLHHNGPDAQRVLETQLVPMVRQAMRRGQI